MDQYALRDHYQKRIDAVSDRFWKQVGLTTLIFTGITWSMFSASEQFKPFLLIIGIMTVATTFAICFLVRRNAARAINRIRSEFLKDHSEKFNDSPGSDLIGLFV